MQKGWKVFSHLNGKSRKKLLACLLSISMIPVNGFTVMAATADQGNQAAVTQEGTTTPTVTSGISFAAESQNVTVGNFKYYEFQGTQAKDFDKVNFNISDEKALKIEQKTFKQADGTEVVKYMPIALKDSGKLGDGVYPFACPVDFQTWYYQTVYANGGYILSDDKKSTGYDDPKTQEGIQCWIDMYNEGLSPSASALSETTADAMFEGGQLAMNFAGSYMVPEYASNDAIKDKVDCVEIPTFNGKEDNCINGLGYAVFEGSKNKEAAEDFAIWLGSKEAQEIQGKTGVVISARTDAQKCFAEANSQYNLAAYTNHADEAYPLPVCTKAAELYDLEATELQKAYNGEESLSDVCKSLTKQADKLLQE